MSAAPARLLLHVGAPHCGSVALQTALSATPSLPTQDGQELRYTALSPQSGGWTVLSGRSLRMAAERSIKGCTATTAPAETDSAPFFAALDRVRRKAGRTGDAAPGCGCAVWVRRRLWHHPAPACPPPYTAAACPVGVFDAEQALSPRRR